MYYVLFTGDVQSSLNTKMSLFIDIVFLFHQNSPILIFMQNSTSISCAVHNGLGSEFDQ